MSSPLSPWAQGFEDLQVVSGAQLQYLFHWHCAKLLGSIERQKRDNLRDSHQRSTMPFDTIFILELRDHDLREMVVTHGFTIYWAWYKCVAANASSYKCNCLYGCWVWINVRVLWTSRLGFSDASVVLFWSALVQWTLGRFGWIPKSCNLGFWDRFTSHTCRGGVWLNGLKWLGAEASPHGGFQ